MPGKTEPTSPSPGLLQRLFGLSPDVQASWEKMQREYPDKVAQTRMIGEMGPLSRILYSGAYANTNPFGMINVNTNLINKDKADIDSVLAHELEHVKQMRGQSILQNIFGSKEPLENQAYAEEDMRHKRMMGFRRDINLPVEKR